MDSKLLYILLKVDHMILKIVLSVVTIVTKNSLQSFFHLQWILRFVDHRLVDKTRFVDGFSGIENYKSEYALYNFSKNMSSRARQRCTFEVTKEV